jgi:hypothetical protein
MLRHQKAGRLLEKVHILCMNVTKEHPAIKKRGAGSLKHFMGV